jgi:hypothetical protein
MSETVINVSDKRRGWIGSWETEPLVVSQLGPDDVGRTVIYRDYGRAEAGTLSSWRGNTVFAKLVIVGGYSARAPDEHADLAFVWDEQTLKEGVQGGHIARFDVPHPAPEQQAFWEALHGLVDYVNKRSGE